MNNIYKTSSVEETQEVGFNLGRMLKSGDVVCLNGDLGVGKTAFTVGIAKALAINEYITSPTFTIVNEYEGNIPMYHFDVYRIADSEDMFEIGFEEYLSGDGIVIIEWADLIKNELPESYIKVEILKNIESDADERIIKIEFIGERNEE